MNIVRQVVTSSSLRFEGADGRIVALISTQIRDAANTGGGSAAVRRQRGVDFVKTQLINGLGADRINPAEFVMTYDPATGQITEAGIQRGT